MSKAHMLKVFPVFFAIFFLTQSAQAYDGDRHRRHHRDASPHFRHHSHHSHHRHHHRHHHRRGEIVFSLPFGFTKIDSGPQRYYHCDGTYYRRHRQGYVVVDPPPEVIIDALPAEYDIQIINGVTYYKNDGIYYQSTGRGYQVVPPPPSAVINTASLSQRFAGQNTDGSFTINILNSQGGYNAVTLTKSGNGFVGPQGEFYHEFPRVEQLKVMYGQ